MNGVERVGSQVGAESVDDGSAAGQRDRKRDSMFLSARLSLGGSATTDEVRVRNLSAGGLMAELDRPVDADTPVVMEMRGVGKITGRVVWWTRGRLGIAFDEPIDPSRARTPVGVAPRPPSYVAAPAVAARRR